MRKIYFFLSLFLTALTVTGTATAQEVEGGDDASGVVYLYNTGKGTFLQIDGTEAGATFSLVAGTDTEVTKWELVETGTENQVRIKNVSTGLYLGACAQSTNVTAVNEAAAVVYEHSVLENGNDVFRDTSNEDTQYSYLHVNGKLLGWATGAAATQWLILTPEQLPALNANLAAKDNLAAALTAALEFYPRTQPGDRALITSADQLSTNAQETSEGPIANLIDGNTNTYFHSTWNANNAIDANHNLQVSLPGNELTEILIKYYTRTQNNNNRPTTIEVYGGKTVEGTTTWGEAPFTTLTTNDGLGNVSGEVRFTADQVYDAFRFDVTATNSGAKCGDHVFFTYSEFNLYEEDAIPAEFNKVDETLIQNLLTAIANAQKASLRDDNYSELIAALENAVTAIRATITVERTDLLTAIEAAKAKLAELCASENTPGYLSPEEKAAAETIIATAQAVADDNTKTEADCAAARTTLNEAMNTLSPANPVVYPTDGYFTIHNPNGSRGAIVYDPAHAEQTDATTGNSEYLWFADAPDATNDNHLWGFYVNPENQEVYLYNVGKRLFASSAGKGNFGDTWIFSKTPCPITMEAMTTPFMHIIGGEKTMSVSRSYVGPIITYYAAGDAGVPFRFTRVEKAIDPEVTAAIENLLNPSGESEYNELVTLIDQLNGTIEAAKPNTEKIGYHTAEAVAALEAAVATAQAAVDAITTDYTPAIAALAALQEAETAYDAEGNFILPENGKTYTIKSDNLEANYYQVLNEENTLVLASENPGNDACKWFCTVEDDGTYTFQNEATGKYLGFKAAADEAYYWTLGATKQNTPGCITMYGGANSRFLVISNDGKFDQAQGTFDKNTTNFSTDFIFEEVERYVTGIDRVNAAAQNGAIYNVAGQKLNKSLNELESGLYIVNGKKVLVK